MSLLNEEKTILDLCGGTGGWSKPYVDAGYAVLVVDLNEWQDGPGVDVRQFEHMGEVYGVLAAPPCTDLSGSGAQYWKKKDIEYDALRTALAVADACIRISVLHRATFWALENPVGRLRRFYGEPTYIFNPHNHGDPYTKKTLLWGQFNTPQRHEVEPVRSNKQGSWLQSLGGKSDKTKMLRSQTPAGFARDFFEANK